MGSAFDVASQRLDGKRKFKSADLVKMFPGAECSFVGRMFATSGTKRRLFTDCILGCAVQHQHQLNRCNWLKSVKAEKFPATSSHIRSSESFHNKQNGHQNIAQELEQSSSATIINQDFNFA